MTGNKSCDWISLPSELVHLISTKLYDLSDRVRLRAVCKTWKLAVIPLSSPSSPCLPWFIADYAMEATDKICYYSLSSNKTNKIQFPHPQPPEHTYYLSAADGNLLCSQPYSELFSLFKLNPLTGLMIPLPPLKDYIVVLEIVSDLLQEDFLAVLGFNDRVKLGDSTVSFLRPGKDDAWVTIPLGISSYEAVCVYYKGLFYINDLGYKHTRIIDTTDEFVSIFPCPAMSRCPIARQYILESCGDILMILRHSSTKLEDITFSIFRLDELRGDYKWVEVRGIGDQLLFLNTGNGFFLGSSHFYGYKGNCIYFLKRENGDDDDFECPKMLLCRHDLENGKTEILPNFFGTGGTWFFPQLI